MVGPGSKRPIAAGEMVGDGRGAVAGGTLAVAASAPGPEVAAGDGPAAPPPASARQRMQIAATRDDERSDIGRLQVLGRVAVARPLRTVQMRTGEGGLATD